MALELNVRPFKRWLDTLRHHDDIPVTTPCMTRRPLDDFDTPPASPTGPWRSRHRKSLSSSSSTRFVTAIKSATITLASTSLAPRSRRRTQRSSQFSGSDVRPSFDTQRSVASLDPAAIQRSYKRMQKLNELILTEEDYTADLRALSTSYTAIVGDVPTSTAFIRPSARQHISLLLKVHTYELLPMIQSKIASLTQLRSPDHAARFVPRSPCLHARWQSIDNGSGRNHLEAVTDVTQAFLAVVPLLNVYQDYAAAYELIREDIDELVERTEGWPHYERAVEILAHAASSNSTRSRQIKKALTLKDLLMKPIQRLPRYVLLVSELKALTPACDAPNTHTLLKKLVDNLKELCECVDDALNTYSKAGTESIRVAWRLGEMLTFADQVPRDIFVQQLGSVILCGCLHIAFCGLRRVKGHFAVVILYEARLIVASLGPGTGKLRIQLSIDLKNAVSEHPGDGFGLQCPATPYTWKVAFTIGYDNYELLLSACSETEAEVWQTSIRACVLTAADMPAQLPLASPLREKMRPVGRIINLPIYPSCETPIQRAATTGSKRDQNQIIIRNTWCKKSDQSERTIQRSQSDATPNHVVTLVPSKDDRQIIEEALQSVWTKDKLPYPGMQEGRSLRRPMTMARKFSMGSIASSLNFSTRRSESRTSMNSSKKEDKMPEACSGSSRTLLQKPRPQLSDILPADFELTDPVTRKRSALSLFR